jgi:hypothetical protein
MRNILVWGSAVVLAGLAGILVVLAYLGAFIRPAVRETAMGPYTYVYEEFVGDYKKTAPVFDRVFLALQQEGIAPTKGIGIYLDDPRRVPAAKLRSLCGSVIEGGDLAGLPRLKERFRTGELPVRNSVVAEFPLKNTFSYVLGPLKGYPALVRYANGKGYRMTQTYELYDIPEQKILYVMPVEQ